MNVAYLEFSKRIPNKLDQLEWKTGKLLQIYRSLHPISLFRILLNLSIQGANTIKPDVLLMFVINVNDVLKIFT